MIQALQAISKHLTDNGIKHDIDHARTNPTILILTKTKPGFHIHHPYLWYHIRITHDDHGITLTTKIPNYLNTETSHKWDLANPQLFNEILLTIQTLP